MGTAATATKMTKSTTDALRRVVRRRPGKKRALARKGESKLAQVRGANSAAVVKKDALAPFQKTNLVLKYRLKARKIARSILRKWHSRIDPMEIDSIVDLSLCETVQRFNPAKGAGFITFLFYHLRGNLIRAVETAANANAVPMAEYEDIDAALTHERGEAPNALKATATEIAEALSSEQIESPDDAFFKQELREVSAQACSGLDPLEREVIYRLFVLEHQLMDIAKTLGYSRCHISRVKRKALDTLEKALSPYLELSSNSDEGATGELQKSRRSRIRKILKSDGHAALLLGRQ